MHSFLAEKKKEIGILFIVYELQEKYFHYIS